MKNLQNFKTYKFILIFVVLLLFGSKMKACDLCSCTTSGGSSAFGDLSMSNFIGFRYIHQVYESIDGIFSNSPKINEEFDTYQIWAKIPLNDSFYLSTVIPFQNFTREFELDDTMENINGLGDINIMGWYKLPLYKKHTKRAHELGLPKEISNHTLNFGLGLKLPTGEFEQELNNGGLNPGFQVGTGSLDLFTSIMHGYQRNNFGIASTLTYYYKTENKNEYQYGNQFSYASSVFYDIDMKVVKTKPFLSLSGDVYNSIEQYGEELQETDGSIFYGSLGSEFIRNRMLFGMKYTLPIKQDLLGGNVTSKNQFSVYLNYTL